MKVENTSGLEPAGRAVLVRPLGLKTGKIELPPEVSQRTDMVEVRGQVIAVGDSCWHDEPYPRAEVGDYVMMTKFAGFFAIGPQDGQKYRLVNDRDIFCRVTFTEDLEN